MKRAGEIRVRRASVLASPNPPIAELLAIAKERATAGPFDEREAAGHRAAWTDAIEREPSLLADWKEARSQELVTAEEFAEGVMAIFRRALQRGFRARLPGVASGPEAFVDHAGFAAMAPVVGARDPDLCLLGFMALTDGFNTNGLHDYAAEWQSVLPTSGYRPAVLSLASAHFSDASRIATARTLRELLAACGVTVTTPVPPTLDGIDVVVDVGGSDCGTLVIGSFDVVSRVAATDFERWAEIVRDGRAIGLHSDLGYRVRIVGQASYSMRSSSKGKCPLVFPLVIEDDALTISGVVCQAGMPTISFPSGRYTAFVSVDRRSGVVTVVIVPSANLVDWTFGAFGDDLPTV